ncbi:hypothetical protein HN803_07120 [candidate division WWE3 bacterium]|jgi:hypothetical protein|nr:hypothetical protein [candidate division WWE3 bacterium]
MKLIKAFRLAEAMYTVTNYWITPKGKVDKTSAHEYWLADHSMSYGKAYDTGHIRVAVSDSENGTVNAQWSKAATGQAKRVLAKFVKESDKAYVDLVEPLKNDNIRYLKSDTVNYKDFMRKYAR